MKIYLYLDNKIISFSLPNDISGSFSFDEKQEEESKLINIEARNDTWVLYSTEDATVIANNNMVADVELKTNTFYIIRRKEINYLIYVTALEDNKTIAYSYSKEINLIIGNDKNKCNIYYDCEFLTNGEIKLFCKENQLIIEKTGNINFYINNKAVAKSQYIKAGDEIILFGIKIIIVPGLLLIIFPKNKVEIVSTSAGINNYYLSAGQKMANVEIKDEDLYNEEDFFSKAPRIRRTIETKEIKLSPPPSQQENKELPLILTIGPMLTMGIMAAVMLINTLNRIYLGDTTLAQSWPQLVMSIAMLISMILWPLLTKFYNKKMKQKAKEHLIERYGEYLKDKEKELVSEAKLQKEILIENLITVEECANIIQNKNVSFWNKRVDQNDFLTVRLGTGNELLDVKVEYPEEGFTIDEDELRKQADALVEKYKYIENVPIGYSFYTNKITAIMGEKNKIPFFINNILLQLLTFYSYEDIKLVVFTNEEQKENWDYIKYLNHNFNNEKNFRLFASTVESAKNVAEYLHIEVNRRISNAKNENNYFKPHYIIIIDDYSRVKRHEFIKEVTESDKDLGFSIILIEDRISKLPSKCNNFITLGNPRSGILKNAYEKQEQIIFYDEINYKIGVENFLPILANIPIEFEEGTSQLPEAISFLEMEKVGKVEQLNILNRWNTNNPTTSLKAEIGVDDQGDLMYLDLHEKQHGPHGLIAGMTGSGKSEFIITYILSMAINYSPDDVSFILIDYKGGGLAFAFENKTANIVLPHLAGTITNLDKAEMDRTLVSINSEAQRRQKLFNEVRDQLGESTMDIYKYQRLYKEGKIKEAIPHLFIICDEFAELKSQQPEFMDNLISIARIGRSLGVHLILATQKPSGVVNDQIWSNSKFNICLKVQDAGDSNEMLKKPDAALLKQTGRFYLQVGYDEYFALGQSGWCGAKYFPSDKIVKQVDKSINIINDNAEFIKSIQASSQTKVAAQGEQITAILNSVIKVAKQTGKKAKRLWLDNIPDVILVDDLVKKYNVTEEPYNIEAVIGEYDAPEKQEQGLLKYSPIEEGSTIIYSMDQQESEMLLNTIIYSTIISHTPEEINYYIIDYGSQTFTNYNNIPHVGGVVLPGEDEKYRNLFKMIREELTKRKTTLVEYGGMYKNYVKSSEQKMPLKVIIMNNYDAINEADKTLYDTFPELIRSSDRYGIVFIITANATNSVPRKVSQNVDNIYAYKIKDPTDYYIIFNNKKKLVPRDIFGRGIYLEDSLYEFQTASVIKDQAQLNQFLQELSVKLKDKNSLVASKIPELPAHVTLDYVKDSIKDITELPIGMTTEELEIDSLDITGNTITLILANKRKHLQAFITSLIKEIKLIKNINIIAIDAIKLLDNNKLELVNYYSDSLEEVVPKLTEYLNNIKSQENYPQREILVIYGIKELIEKVSDKKQVEELIKAASSCKKAYIIVAEEGSKIKELTFDAWYKENVNTLDGLWVGNGVGDQTLLKINSYSQALSKSYKNDIGFHIAEGSYKKIKLLEFDPGEETENEK